MPPSFLPQLKWNLQGNRKNKRKYYYHSGFFPVLLGNNWHHCMTLRHTVWWSYLHTLWNEYHNKFSQHPSFHSGFHLVIGLFTNIPHIYNTKLSTYTVCCILSCLHFNIRIKYSFWVTPFFGHIHLVLLRRKRLLFRSKRLLNLQTILFFPIFSAIL